MKFQIASILALSTTLSVASAFSTPTPSLQQGRVVQAQPTTSTTSLSMSTDSNSNRRQAISSIFSGITIATATATAASLLQTQPAFAAARQPLPEYLTEPTEEFKESERQRDEFRRKQLTIKRKFNTVLDRFTFESNAEEELINDLKELRYLVIETEGLPLGIKKEEVVKIIRAKKAKGFWPTDVEIAYQKLTGEIAYQQSPNREKDIANPL